MTTTNDRKAPFWLGLLLGIGVLLASLAATADQATPTADPPAGQLLIAAATIQDPRFYHSVILLVHHDAKGAFGLMINHPIGEQPIADLLADSTGAGRKAAGPSQGPGGNADAKIAPTIGVFLGGPVEPQYGFVIHSADYHTAATVAIADGIAMTANREVLRDIGNHRGPAKYLFAIGYSGWGAGQLESEIARRDWFTEPATPDLVFDKDTDGIWKKALSRRTREL
jgi:putative transcriptional regulator